VLQIDIDHGVLVKSHRRTLCDHTRVHRPCQPRNIRCNPDIRANSGDIAAPNNPKPDGLPSCGRNIRVPPRSDCIMMVVFLIPSRCLLRDQRNHGARKTVFRFFGLNAASNPCIRRPAPSPSAASSVAAFQRAGRRRVCSQIGKLRGSSSTFWKYGKEGGKGAARADGRTAAPSCRRPPTPRLNRVPAGSNQVVISRKQGCAYHRLGKASPAWPKPNPDREQSSALLRVGLGGSPTPPSPPPLTDSTPNCSASRSGVSNRAPCLRYADDTASFVHKKSTAFLYWGPAQWPRIPA